MSDPTDPDALPVPEPDESFQDLLSQFEQTHSHKPADGSRQLEGTVVAVSAESVFLDIGYKTEGILPLEALRGEAAKPGDRIPVSIKGRDPQGYYELTRLKVAQPTDWASLERAFESKATIVGRVTAVVKGGLSVDVGVRAFMPASRSGTRDAAEMEKLVEQEIRCRIIKLDVGDEDVVVDRRAVLQEEERALKERRYSELAEGLTVSGVVRSLTDYGAFVDIDGVDALLHVSDISWGRVNKASDVLAVGQELEVKVLKITSEPGKQRISVGLKQLQPQPWDSVTGKYVVGAQVHGTVTRIVDFGAFVELEPGVEGLIHLSEMSWSKRVRKASDIVKQGETVEATILGINPGERRISLGLKQALGDPWIGAAQKFAAGAVVAGPVTSLTKFGAFVQIAEGIEGMIHVSEISAEKRLNHPQEALKVGQVVKAQVISVDAEKRRIALSMKQLVPAGLDEFLAERHPGDVVTGRITEVSGGVACVELGEGIQATCRLSAEVQAAQEEASPSKADLSSLSSMLQAKWKSGPSAGDAAKPSELRAGQVRSFRIGALDPANKQIHLELA